MDRSSGGTNFREVGGAELHVYSLTSPCTFHPDQLRLEDDLLIDHQTGIIIGRMWAALRLGDIESVTITSSTIGIEDHRLVICCSHCRRKMTLVEMGLRKMRPGRAPVRNQPQCPECRGRYRK